MRCCKFSRRQVAGYFNSMAIVCSPGMSARNASKSFLSCLVIQKVLTKILFTYHTSAPFLTHKQAFDCYAKTVLRLNFTSQFFEQDNFRFANKLITSEFCHLKERLNSGLKNQLNILDSEGFTGNYFLTINTPKISLHLHYEYMISFLLNYILLQIRDTFLFSAFTAPFSI